MSGTYTTIFRNMSTIQPPKDNIDMRHRVMCKGEGQNRKRVLITLKKSGRKAYWPPQAARLEASRIAFEVSVFH